MKAEKASNCPFQEALIKFLPKFRGDSIGPEKTNQKYKKYINHAGPFILFFLRKEFVASHPSMKKFKLENVYFDYFSTLKP